MSGIFISYRRSDSPDATGRIYDRLVTGFGKAQVFVRIELETALARDIPVVPVLVGHAQLPVASELPGSLASLVFRQSIEVRPDPDFHNDATRLVTALRAILDPAAAAEQAAAAVARSAPATSAQTARRRGWIIATARGLCSLPAGPPVPPTFI